jgi:L-aspartate oxidase
LGLGWKQNQIVIIGAGLAGLFAALKLSPTPVTVVTSATLGKGASSSWAQGGIAAAIEEGDTPFDHAFDTMQAGAGIVNPDIAKLLANEAASRIEDLLSYGTPFDRNLEGDLLLSREAAHSARRVVRVKGDKAGWAIMKALIAAVENTPSIQVLEGYTAKHLDVSGNRVQGVHIWSKKGEHIYLPARAIVLAAGGSGALYKVTTNPEQANGEALGMAARAGAVLADTEFVQFHPTAINSDQDPAPLATEALRGEGAVLINKDGKRFMQAVHEDAELAPRDIVARAVFRENVAGRGAFLDCRDAIGKAFPEQFPSVFKKCEEAGINPVKQPIPVAPAAHFHMGGIYTDAVGRTTINGLWACGEIASTGAHGANRLASNSLLEAVVFAARVAEELNKIYLEPFRDRSVIDAPTDFKQQLETQLRKKHLKVIAELRGLMDRHVGIERDKESLVQVIQRLSELEKENARHLTLTNMITAAKVITVTALMREESRGSHYRTDFPKPSRKFERRLKVSLNQVEEAAKAVTKKLVTSS